MQDLKKLKTDTLVDLLARYTSEYINMIVKRNSIIELGQCEYEIAIMQSELNARQLTAANNASNDTDGEVNISEGSGEEN